jgi:hypothetical protein
LRVAALARTTNAFRLRGVGFKLARYIFTMVIGMEATNRMMRRLGIKPRVPRPKPEEMTRHQLMSEVARLRRTNDQWHDWHQEQKRYLFSNGHPPLPSEPPADSGPGANATSGVMSRKSC